MNNLNQLRTYINIDKLPNGLINIQRVQVNEFTPINFTTSIKISEHSDFELPQDAIREEAIREISRSILNLLQYKRISNPENQTIEHQYNLNVLGDKERFELKSEIKRIKNEKLKVMHLNDSLKLELQKIKKQSLFENIKMWWRNRK